jgi:hypothetical protein
VVRVSRREMAQKQTAPAWIALTLDKHAAFRL